VQRNRCTQVIGGASCCHPCALFACASSGLHSLSLFAWIFCGALLNLLSLVLSRSLALSCSRSVSFSLSCTCMFVAHASSESRCLWLHYHILRSVLSYLLYVCSSLSLSLSHSFSLSFALSSFLLSSSFALSRSLAPSRSLSCAHKRDARTCAHARVFFAHACSQLYSLWLYSRIFHCVLPHLLSRPPSLSLVLLLLRSLSQMCTRAFFVDASFEKQHLSVCSWNFSLRS